jgi:hypothetical protein
MIGSDALHDHRALRGRRPRAELDEWIEAWNDLVRFEVVEVVTSTEAAEAVDRDVYRR